VNSRGPNSVIYKEIVPLFLSNNVSIISEQPSVILSKVDCGSHIIGGGLLELRAGSSAGSQTVGVGSLIRRDPAGFLDARS